VSRPWPLDSHAIFARPRLSAAAGVLLVWAGAAAWLAIDFAGRIRDWSVMTDELLYTKLASAIARTHSPLPELHETRVDVLNQLYPILISPLYGSLSAPDAFHAAHVLNAVVMASAAVPAYLLARQIVQRWWALAVAAVSVVLPWMVLTGVLMTESAAYPAFLWAMLALHRSVAAPSRRNDVLAVAGLLLAILARTQFVLLVAVLPLAVFGSELADSRSLRDAAIATYRRHRVLAWLYVIGAAVVGVVAGLGSLGKLLGSYAVTTHGSPLPAGVWGAAAAHLDAVAIGLGVVPLVLGGGWILATVGRARERSTQALALLSLLTIVALTFETASYDVRFGAIQIVRDRYLFYISPLLLAGTAAAIRGTPRRSVAIGAAALTALFAATVHLLAFPTAIAFWVDAPTRGLNDFLARQAGSLGTSAFVALAGLCLGIAAIAGLLFLPRLPFAVLTLGFLLPFAALSTRHEIDRVTNTKGSSTRALTGAPDHILDWADRILPANAKVAMVPFPQSPEFALNAVFWWDVEFWNDSVVRTLVSKDGLFTYAPFPDQRLAADWRSGLVAGTRHAPSFVIVAQNDPRVGLRGERQAMNFGLNVLSVDRPYRADWQTRGLAVDGWTLPGRPVRIRVYSQADAPQAVGVQVVLGAPRTAPAAYSFAGRTRHIAAGAFATEKLETCVPPHSYFQFGLRGLTKTSVSVAPTSFDAFGARLVGVRVGPITADFTGKPC
jgi:hypothetical protein